MPCNLRDLLHRRDSLHRHLISTSLVLLVRFAFVSSPARPNYDVWRLMPPEFLPILSLAPLPRHHRHLH